MLRGYSGFREMLAVRQKRIDSLVCVGLDPLPEKLPACLWRDAFDNCPTCMSTQSYAIANWMIQIVNATAPFASMFKPQRAHWEAFPYGEETLRLVITHIHGRFPDIPVFLDCKRGDIGRTQSRYREAQFGLDNADGMNFSPYMGKDCMQFLVDKDNYPGRALVGLCYTSNEPARQIQDIALADGRRYWEFIAEAVLQWAEELGVVADVGLVMAAAHEYPKGSGKIFSYHLSRVREIVGDKLWFLIPGIGTQKGFVKETVKAAFIGPGSIAINSSSGIIFASSGDDYAEAAAEKTKKLRDEIRDYAVLSE